MVHKERGLGSRPQWGLGNRHSLLGPARDHVSLKFFVSFGCFVVNFFAFPCLTKRKNSRATRTDDRSRTSSSLRVARPCHRHSENLAGSAVRCGPARGQRFLLRCRSSPPHFARRFRKARGRDETKSKRIIRSNEPKFHATKRSNSESKGRLAALGERAEPADTNSTSSKTFLPMKRSHSTATATSSICAPGRT